MTENCEKSAVPVFKLQVVLHTIKLYIQINFYNTFILLTLQNVPIRKIGHASEPQHTRARLKDIGRIICPGLVQQRSQYYAIHCLEIFFYFPKNLIRILNPHCHLDSTLLKSKESLLCIHFLTFGKFGNILIGL